MSLRHLSTAARANPMQSKSLIRQNERAVVKPFREFRQALPDLLAQCTSRSMAARDLAPPPPSVDMRLFNAALADAITGMITDPGEAIVDDMTERSFRHGMTFGDMTLLRTGIEMPLGTGTADWRVLDALKVRNLSSLKGITDEMGKQIIHTLSEGISQGESVVKLTKRIQDRCDHIGKARARTMAHTETMHAANQGAKVRYEQAGTTTGEWLTAHDSKTCPECAALDGRQAPIGKGIPGVGWPPLHPRCRCTFIPVVDD